MDEVVEYKSVVFQDNLTVSAAMIEIGARSIERVAGGEESAGQLTGQSSRGQSIREIIAARLHKQLNAQSPVR